MPISPIQASSDLVSFKIKVAGSEIPDSYAVVSINVLHALNGVASAELILIDGDVADGTFPISDSDTFVPGAEVSIELGYDTKNRSVFKGLVTGTNISAKSDGTHLRVWCDDAAIKMMRGTQQNSYRECKITDVFEQLASRNGVAVELSDSAAVFEELVQSNECDWDFVVAQAIRLGMVVNTDSGTLRISMPDNDSAPILGLQFGEDIIEFDLEVNALSQYSSVQAQFVSGDVASEKSVGADDWHPKNSGNITPQKLATAIDSGVANIYEEGNYHPELLKQLATGALIYSRLAKLRGRLVFQGSVEAKVNSYIELKGLGNRFNGDAYISAVQHTVKEGNWQTEVTIGL